LDIGIESANSFLGIILPNSQVWFYSVELTFTIQSYPDEIRIRFTFIST